MEIVEASSVQRWAGQQLDKYEDVELSNNLSGPMMRSIKMNLKNAGNIGSEESARHNAFMFSVIESRRKCGRSVERYLAGLLERLKVSKDGDDMTGCLPCFMPA